MLFKTREREKTPTRLISPAILGNDETSEFSNHISIIIIKLVIVFIYLFIYLFTITALAISLEIVYLYQTLNFHDVRAEFNV